MYASNSTDLVIDVNGYFTQGAGLEFYPVAPCRIVETRQGGGAFGAPRLEAGQTRSFPFSQGGCGVPANAQAYYVNFTVVPPGLLGYLTAYPSGQARPFTSTLNDLDGRILANGAIVAAGANAGIDVFVTDATHLVIDIAGYFAPGNGTTSQLFNTILPCRAATLAMQAAVDQSPQLAGTCGVPGSSSAVALNMTAAMNQPVGYFSLWPAGVTFPGVSVMNAIDAIPGMANAVGNGPIVQAGFGGQVMVRSADAPSTVTLDVTGYFAAAAAPPPPTCQLFSDPTPASLTATRGGGNLVWGQGSLRLSAPAVGNWLVYLRAHLNFRPSGSNAWAEATYNEVSTSIKQWQAYWFHLFFWGARTG